MDGHEVSAVVLGTAQDGGVPQAGCTCVRCAAARRDPAVVRRAASLGLVDAAAGRFLIDATPDLPGQLHDLLAEPCSGSAALAGVLLTHAHVGHYAGLLHFGREVRAERALPVHCSDRMARFLGDNAPWSQLVALGHVELRRLHPGEEVALTADLRVTPLLVPHRDELSDTLAFVVAGPRRRLLWLPDIDAWEDWDRRIEDVLDEVDVAFVDGTFWSADELPGRDLASVPHPLASETVERVAGRRAHVHLVHLNHSNALLGPETGPRRAVETAGVQLAEERQRVAL